MLLIIFSIINSIMLIFAIVDQIKDRAKFTELEDRIAILELESTKRNV